MLTDCAVADKTPSVRMWYERLVAVNGSDRLPLSAFATHMHVHGGLRLELGGRLVPHLGYWGPDDVCFGMWLGELWQVVRALEQVNGRHVFDEGEQGQPAFVFEREGERGFFSIAPSEYSDAANEADWHRIEFAPAEFIGEFERLHASFVANLREAAPVAAEGWLRRFAREPE